MTEQEDPELTSQTHQNYIYLLSSCFAESFSFNLSFKGFVNKINHLLYKNRQYKYLLENHLAYFQCTNIKGKEKQKKQRIHHHIGFQPTSRLNQRWEVHVTARLESQLGKDPRHHFLSVGETLKIMFRDPHLQSQMHLVSSSICDRIAALVSC